MANDTYWVQATKKGGLPLSTEKRKYGKPVTIIQGCGGDVEGLLTSIKSALGTGGCTYGGTGLELQGSLVEQVGAWLLRAGCVRGLAKKKSDSPEAATGSADGDAAQRREAREAQEARSSKPRWSTEKSAAAAATVTNRAPSASVLLGKERDPYRVFCALMRSWCYWDQVREGTV